MNARLFGTTGIRRIYGSDFTLDMALDLGKALGTYLGGEGNVVIARDTRTTGAMVADAVAAGLMSTGMNIVHAGIIPTPTLAFITRDRGFATGVMVTASHNPPEYTGVKFWRADGMGYTPEEEARLEEIYYSKRFIVAPWDKIGTASEIADAVDQHIDALLRACDTSQIRARPPSVVVDPGNGAACLLTPYLLQRLGCKVVSINSQPDGHFPGRRSEPDEESLVDLVNMVRATHSDLGVAHDGDSDRVVFVTETGEVVRGDRIIALLSREILSSGSSNKVVTTVDSSQIVEKTVESAGGQTIRTPVGDIQVAMKMREENAVFGGEACGVFIFSEFSLAPEPFLATCRLIEMMARTGKRLSELIAQVPAYPLRKTKVNCENERKAAVMERLTDTLPKAIGTVTKTLTVDGIAVFGRDGWVLVRPSGTEPVIRITCEATTEETVEQILQSSKRAVMEAVASTR